MASSITELASQKAVSILAVLMFIVLTLLSLGVKGAVPHAILDMTWGLVICWVVILGSLMYLNRDRIKRLTGKVNLGKGTKFFLGATILALIEEAIATTMTNLAPEFGVKTGQAYITASANYVHVILFHSVIVFLPMFAAWAWLLKKYSFSAKQTALLFGITGFLAESFSFGLNPLALPMWIFVYGLMVYLPAYLVLPVTGSKDPGILNYLEAIILPFICAIPVAILIIVAFHVPGIEFPPIS